MNREALQLVQPYLNIFNVHPTDIMLNSVPLNDQTLLARSGQAVAFSRFQWECIGATIAQLKQADASDQAMAPYLYSISVKTRSQFAVQPEAGPTPETEPIPTELVFATMDLTFSVDYHCAIDPETLDQDGLQEFIRHNSPYHFWPYWRELMQNLCVRAQLPLPSLPSYRVPNEAKPQSD